MTDSFVSDIKSGERRLPAEEGLWAFIIGDMVLFAIFFNVFLYYARLEPDVFVAGQNALDTEIGLLNTFVLLISSWFVVLGVRAVRAGVASRARHCFISASLLGVTFVVVKIFEYSGKISAGYTPANDMFFMLYYVFTGIHLAHVILGIAFLAVVIRFSDNAANEGKHTSLIEGGAIFWHMVDLLWIVLFPLIYLVSAS